MCDSDPTIFCPGGFVLLQRCAKNTIVGEWVISPRGDFRCAHFRATSQQSEKSQSLRTTPASPLAVDCWCSPFYGLSFSFGAEKRQRPIMKGSLLTIYAGTILFWLLPLAQARPIVRNIRSTHGTHVICRCGCGETDSTGAAQRGLL